MFIHAIVLEVRHHVSQPRLSCRFRSFLLNFVHLFKVFLSCWVELIVETFLGLCLQWPSLRFGYLIHFKSASHCRMHHDLAGCLNFLKAIKRHVVQIACTVEVSLLVSHHLLEETVASSFPLFLLEK